MGIVYENEISRKLERDLFFFFKSEIQRLKINSSVNEIFWKSMFSLLYNSVKKKNDLAFHAYCYWAIKYTQKSWQ